MHLTDLSTTFISHFVVKRNVIFEREKFQLRSQRDIELVDDLT